MLLHPLRSGFTLTPDVLKSGVSTNHDGDDKLVLLPHLPIRRPRCSSTLAHLRPTSGPPQVPLKCPDCGLAARPTVVHLLRDCRAHSLKSLELGKYRHQWATRRQHWAVVVRFGPALPARRLLCIEIAARAYENFSTAGGLVIFRLLSTNVVYVGIK